MVSLQIVMGLNREAFSGFFMMQSFRKAQDIIQVRYSGRQEFYSHSIAGTNKITVFYNLTQGHM
jgi:hypothetical protein